MRSSELARLAGVTVRTLRHYHQVGVLPEPARGHNSYRNYDVHDLIRVARIRRLASLGIPLERMPGILDDEDSDDGLLASLDAELEAQIAQLTEQRAVIARLREHDAAPDLPPELAPFIAMSAGAGMSPEMARLDRDQSVLLVHLAGDAGMPAVARFYERISAPDVAEALAQIGTGFEALGPASSERDIEQLVEKFVAVIGPLMGEFDDTNALTPEASSGLFGEYMSDVLNAQQREALKRVEAQFAQ